MNAPATGGNDASSSRYYAGHLFRCLGRRPGLVNVGDKDGSDGGYVLGVILEDGTQF